MSGYDPWQEKFLESRIEHWQDIRDRSPQESVPWMSAEMKVRELQERLEECRDEKYD